MANQIDRMEGKLDAANEKLDKLSERIAVAETDAVWVKRALKILGTVLLGVVGKLAHLTFLTK